MRQVSKMKQCPDIDRVPPESAVGCLWLRPWWRRDACRGSGKKAPFEDGAAVRPSQRLMSEVLAEEGGCAERRRRWDGTFGQLGPICRSFSRAGLGIKWHEIEHRPGSPQRQGSPRPGGENAEGAGVGGVAHATLRCFWVQMEREWKGAEPAPPPQLLPTSSLLTQAEGLPDPSVRLKPGLAPLCPQTPESWGWGGGNQARAPFRGPLGPFCLSQRLCCHFCPVLGNGD